MLMGFCPKNLSRRTQLFPKITFSSISMGSPETKTKTKKKKEKRKERKKKDLQMAHISNVLLSPKQ